MFPDLQLGIILECYFMVLDRLYLWAIKESVIATFFETMYAGAFQHWTSGVENIQNRFEGLELCAIGNDLQNISWTFYNALYNHL